MGMIFADRYKKPSGCNIIDTLNVANVNIMNKLVIGSNAVSITKMLSKRNHYELITDTITTELHSGCI